MTRSDLMVQKLTIQTGKWSSHILWWLWQHRKLRMWSTRRPLWLPWFWKVHADQSLQSVSSCSTLLLTQEEALICGEAWWVMEYILAVSWTDEQPPSKAKLSWRLHYSCLMNWCPDGGQKLQNWEVFQTAPTNQESQYHWEWCSAMIWSISLVS